MSSSFRMVAFVGQDSRHQEATVAIDLDRIADRGIVMIGSGVFLLGTAALGHLGEDHTCFVEEAAEMAGCQDDLEVVGGNRAGAHLCPCSDLAHGGVGTKGFRVLMPCYVVVQAE